MEAYKKVIWGSMVVIVLLIIPLMIYFFFIKETPVVPAPTPPVDTSTPVSSQAEPQPKTRDTGERLPPVALAEDVTLDTSDQPVRELLNDVSAHPEFSQWLKNRDLLRRAVAVAANIANGESPTAHLQFLFPRGSFEKFAVVEKGEKILVDPLSYRRYDFITRVLVSLETEKLVSRIEGLMPLLDKAYGELGYPGESFRDVLIGALDTLLKTPVPKGDILLEEKITAYAYTDPKLEELSDAQKHLLRMGPGNIRLIRRKLAELKDALSR